MTPSAVPEDHKPKPCCVASRASSPQDADLSALRTPPAAGAVSKGKRATSGMVRLEGGEFLMGTDDRGRFPADGEGPVRAVALKPFWIDPVAVSNERFVAFVDATGYVTDAERYGWSFVFGGLLPNDFPPTRGVAQTPWWRQVFGADWRQPEGPHSSIIEERMNHPVVQVILPGVQAKDTGAQGGSENLRTLREDGRHLPSGDKR